MRVTYASVGFAWGLITSFSAAISPDPDKGMVYLGLGLLLALVATVLAGNVSGLISGWLETTIGLLMTIHVAAAVTSGILNESSPGAVLRYVSLLPAMAVMLAAARSKAHAWDLRLGLTAAGVVFVAYHVVQVPPGALLDPRYRLTLFLNTNSVAFIAAMTAVSVLTLIRNRTRLARAAGWAIVGACCLLLFATKSRTALLAGLAGALIVLYQRVKESRLMMALAGSAAIMVVLASGLVSRDAGAFSDSFSELYSINDPYRSIETGTYRFRAWSHVIHEQWLPNFFLGVGPGHHAPRLYSAVEVTSAHNGVLINLAEVGVIGTVPLLLAIGLSLARARKSPDATWALPILATAIVESGAETMFFSMGNAASLLFLLGIAGLASNPQLTRSSVHLFREATTPLRAAPGHDAQA
jgi:O-antigen ligase